MVLAVACHGDTVRDQPCRRVLPVPARAGWARAVVRDVRAAAAARAGRCRGSTYPAVVPVVVGVGPVADGAGAGLACACAGVLLARRSVVVLANSAVAVAAGGVALLAVSHAPFFFGMSPWNVTVAVP